MLEKALKETRLIVLGEQLGKAEFLAVGRAPLLYSDLFQAYNREPF